MAAVSGSNAFRYDVFLSFRGEDTRLGFTGNLHRALREKGNAIFFDNEVISREETTESIRKAIELSRLYVIVLSENYASSRYCLDELYHILSFSKDNGRLVLPIFYHVDPSDVRDQRGIYGEALEKHNSESNEVMNWRKALSEVANLSDQLTFKDGDGYEYEFIKKIVDKVSKKINPSADRLVGLKHRCVQVKELLNATSDGGVCLVGIHGQGGIGKTTLARAIYHNIAVQFRASLFLENMRERAMKHELKDLLQTRLAETLRENDVQLPNVAQGISLTEQRLGKKVLLVLDDVTKSEQLQALFGYLNLFGPGSSVIITTQDLQLLRVHGVNKIYEVPKLTDDEALQLLCWKAFRTDRVCPVHIEIMLRAKTCASGIPLVLEVIGSNLHGKESEDCQYTLNLYENIPDKNIQRVLEISYDALNGQQKEVFVAIACHYNGLKSAEIENKLSAKLGHKIEPHIEALAEKSLIKIDEHNCVKMHDLIEQMGRNIAKLEPPTHLHKLGPSMELDTDIEEVKRNKKLNVQVGRPAIEEVKKNKKLNVEVGSSSW